MTLLRLLTSISRITGHKNLLITPRVKEIVSKRPKSPYFGPHPVSFQAVVYQTRTVPVSVLSNIVNLNCFRCITTFRYRHDENLNAERILKSIPSYTNLFFQAEEEGEAELKVEQIAQGQLVKRTVDKHWRNSITAFIDAAVVSHDAQLTITHPKNQDVVQNVLKELKLLSDEELCEVLYNLRYFSPCPSSKDPAYHKIWTQIDEECSTRHVNWSIDYWFVVADLWYGLGLARLSAFHWTVIKKLFRRCDKLRKEHFVRFLFCLNLNRDLPDNANAYDLEYRLYGICDQLLAEEIIVIAMSFFKTQTPVRDPELLKKLLANATKRPEELDSISIAALAKFTRFCSDGKSYQTVWNFQEKFVQEIPRLSMAASTHLTLSGTNAMAPHRKLIQAVVNRMENDLGEARLKEIERVSLSMTMFNLNCDNLCALIAEEIQKPDRADEIRKYGRCLPAILHYLSIKNVFLPDLTSMVLSKEFRYTYYGKSKEIFQRELLCLDVAADLEIPEYSGNRLEPKTYNLLMKKSMLKIKSSSKSKISVYQKFIRDVVDVVQLIMKDKTAYHTCSILPQHHAISIVMCRNQKELVSIPRNYLDIDDFHIKKIENNPNLKYLAIVLCGRNMYLHNSKELTGQGHLQVRQTRKLGYDTHLVMFSEWQNFEEQQKKQLIETILQESNK